MDININALLGATEVKYEIFTTSQEHYIGDNDVIVHMKKYLNWLKEKGDTITYIDKYDNYFHFSEVTNIILYMILRTVIAYKENLEPYR